MATDAADASELTSQVESAPDAESTTKDRKRSDAKTGGTGEKTVEAQLEAEKTTEQKALRAAKKARKAAEKARKAAEKARKAAEKARKAAEKARKAAAKAQATAVEPVAAMEQAQALSCRSGSPVSVVVDDPGFADLDRLSFCELLRAGPGFRLTGLHPGSTPGFHGSAREGAAALQAGVEEISDLQERLYAQAKGGGRARLLLLVQGMDTSGKGGIMRHVVGLMDPQGVHITAFEAPTAQEKSRPFLWRIRRTLPKPGQIGVFDRSHYEDVLVVRVHSLVPSSTWTRRYGQINTFEASQANDGLSMIKVMLHLSRQEQGARLAERLDRPDKHWKFNPGDIDERSRWEDYQVAYQSVLERTSTDVAPWYVVPADRKWYTRLAVQRLLLEHLRAMDPQWPPATFDVQEQKQRLAQSADPP